MTNLTRRAAARVAAAAIVAASGALGAFGVDRAAAADTELKFALDWKFEGPAAPYFVAVDKGYFAEEGLSVTIDSGRGSVDAIPKVASGAYQVGFADINSVAKFIDQNPGAPVIGAMMVYDAPPFAIVSTKAQGVAGPKDLEGKILGAPAPDGAYAQWAAFVDANGIDASKVEIQNIGFPVREPMLAAGDVDAITGFSFSSFINLKAKGVPEDDIVVMLMSDYGLDLYGNAIIVNTEFAEENPEAIKGFLTAVAKGWADAVADPAAAVSALMPRNDLADAAVEEERLRMAINDNVMTDNVAANGLGAIERARFEKALEQLALTFDFNAPPSVDALFTDAYLPPADARKMP